MLYKLQGKDYLDLLKYFEDRAHKVKESLFSSVTWSIGFVAAIFGFIITSQVNFNDFSVTHPWGVIVASAIGLILCIYSFIIERESSKHIHRNWERANRCKCHIEGIYAILGEQEPPTPISKWSPKYVGNQVLYVIFSFVLGYIALIGLAVAVLVCPLPY